MNAIKRGNFIIGIAFFSFFIVHTTHAATEECFLNNFTSYESLDVTATQKACPGLKLIGFDYKVTGSNEKTYLPKFICPSKGAESSCKFSSQIITKKMDPGDTCDNGNIFSSDSKDIQVCSYPRPPKKEDPLTAPNNNSTPNTPTTCPIKNDSGQFLDEISFTKTCKKTLQGVFEKTTTNLKCDAKKAITCIYYSKIICPLKNAENQFLNQKAFEDECSKNKINGYIFNESPIDSLQCIVKEKFQCSYFKDNLICNPAPLDENCTKGGGVVTKIGGQWTCSGNNGDTNAEGIKTDINLSICGFTWGVSCPTKDGEIFNTEYSIEACLAKGGDPTEKKSSLAYPSKLPPPTKFFCELSGKIGSVKSDDVCIYDILKKPCKKPKPLPYIFEDPIPDIDPNSKKIKDLSNIFPDKTCDFIKEENGSIYELDVKKTTDACEKSIYEDKIGEIEIIDKKTLRCKNIRWDICVYKEIDDLSEPADSIKNTTGNFNSFLDLLFSLLSKRQY